MKRDAQGRFVDKRARLYLLKFDRGPDERIYALTPSDAVRRRVNTRLPHTMTDLTTVATFAGHRAYAGLGPRVMARIEEPATTWSERMARARREARR